MAISKIYSVRDRLTKWGPAIPFDNEEAAYRYFQTLTQRTPEMNDNPGDYEMYEIGSWDNESGTIIGTKPELKWKGEDLNLWKSENHIRILNEILQLLEHR